MEAPENAILCLEGGIIVEKVKLFATGDTHGDFSRFDSSIFMEQAEMTRNDYALICGDFGGVWSDSPKEREKLDWLENRPFTTLFVDGNHENYDLLEAMPVKEWHGGKVHFVRPHIIHLMRGQVFDIGGSKFFTMGGASSHDIPDGILDPDDPDFIEQLMMYNNMRAMFRIKGRSWWTHELPTAAEYEEARRNLDRVGNKVDYIVTHCCPTSIQSLIDTKFEDDTLTDFLDEIKEKISFRYWLFGHYHDNRSLKKRYALLYEQIVQVL